MHQKKEQLPTMMDGGGVNVRAVSWGDTIASYAQLPGGMDLTPALKGLPDDMCQCPHWGYVFDGAIHVRYTDGVGETV